MRPLVRVALGGLAVAVGFCGGAVAGHVVGPIHIAARSAPDVVAGHGPGTESHGAFVSQAGYSLAVEQLALTGFEGEPFRFRILGPDGAAVQRFIPRHERDLHLVLVRQDLSGYAHLHPALGPGGGWEVALPALVPGTYRAFASFQVAGGPDLTLGVDLVVPGEAGFTPLPEPATTALVDGYVVDMTGAPTAPGSAELAFTVRTGEAPVTDLDPYLGAVGHLVAVRAGDLAYFHVHPLDDGPDLRFGLELPAPGDYRLFLDFSHGGVVHTAAFTLRVPAALDPGEGP